MKSFLYNNLYGYIKLLNWESTFYKRNIALFSFEEDGNKIDDKILKKYDLVQSKIRCDQYRYLDILQFKGFTLAETEVIYLFDNIKNINNIPDYRYAQKNDINNVLRMANKLFNHNTRFRMPWFTEEETTKFYNTWITNSIQGNYDDKCLLIEDKKNIIGFVTIKYLDQNSARIGLIAVNSEYRRQGVGQMLMNIVKNECEQNNINNIYVSTQISNVKAIFLYEATGASIISTNYWLYFD